MGVVALFASAYYTCFVWFEIYTTELLREGKHGEDYNIKEPAAINVGALVLLCMVMVPAGALADKHGNTRMMGLSAFVMLLLSVPVSSKPNPLFFGMF